MKSFENVNYYELLEISPNATNNEIKKAYFKMAHLYHPDKNKEPGAAEKFKLISNAYQVLSNDDTRSEYDFFINRSTMSREMQMRSEREVLNKQDGHSNKDNNFTFDIDYIQHLYSSKFNKNVYYEYFSKLTKNQVIISYSFFWNSFWSGGILARSMIDNQSIISIFDFFINFFKARKVNLFQEYKYIHNNKQEIFQKLKFYQESFNAINKGIEILSEIDAFNYVIDIITKNRTFDDNNFFFFSFELERELKNFINSLLRLYSKLKSNANISNNESRKYSNTAKANFSNRKLNNKKTSKSRFLKIFIIIFTIVIFFIILFFILILFSNKLDLTIF